jgi:hypothetical protein
MAKELKLKTPITALSGEKIEVLSFDFDSLKAVDYRQIIRLEAKLKGERASIDSSTLSKRTSSEFRMATGWVAALKGTKGICFDDIESLSLPDLLEMEEIASFFTWGVE